MPYATAQTGTEIYSERCGNGPPLVLIMGTGLDHTCWHAQVKAYSGQFECIIFDNRGTGQTKTTNEPMATRLMADDTASLMDELGIERVHISGLSLGSCVAQELTLMRPDAALSLQLHGTWAKADGYAGRKFQAQIRLLETLNIRSFYEINVLWFITPESMQRNPDQVQARIDAAVRNNPSAELLIKQYEADLAHDTRDRLSKIMTPTLVTVGTFDLATPPFYARQVAAAIPGAEFVVFDGGGHLHNLDNPDEFNGVTMNFLRRCAC